MNIVDRQDELERQVSKYLSVDADEVESGRTRRAQFQTSDSRPGSRPHPEGESCNVLHLLKFFRPTFTGAGIFLERSTLVFQALAPGVQHDVLVTETPCPRNPVRVPSGLQRVVYLQKGGISHWQRELLLLWWLFWNLRKYSVVHFHTHVDRFFLSYFLAKLFGKRMILSSTLDDSAAVLIGTYRKAYRPIVGKLIRLFDGFIAINPKLQAETIGIVGPKKVHMIPVGVAVPSDSERARKTARATYGIAPHDFVMIFVGGICARKDPLFLVDQLPAVREFCPRVKLVIVGPVLEAAHYENILVRIREYRLEHHILFTGEVVDPYPLFSMADIMVFASHLEGFGCVVTEAMAHGLPAVVRHLPGVNDLFIRQGVTGLLFRTTDEYLAAVRQLIDRPERRREIGDAARGLVLAEFDNIRNARRILKVYGFRCCEEPVAIRERHAER